MTRFPLLFVLAAVLFSLLYPTCCQAQRDRRERPQPFSLGIVIREVRGGVEVREVVAGGLGAAAGVKVGDVVVSLAGQTVASSTDLTKGLVMVARARQVGQTSKIVVLRDGAKMTLTIPAGAAGTAIVTGTPASGPWLGVQMTDAPAAWGLAGAVAYGIAIGSPADEAGVMIGDVITNIGGKAINSGRDLMITVATLKSGQAYPISLQRGSQALALEVTLRDRPTAGSTAKPLPRRRSDINVLTYAVIDPDSRVVTLLGKYDPAYPTGPIPYYDLLQETLRNPYPWFSLEPTAETRAGVAGIDAAISADVKRMATQADYATTWSNRLVNLLLNDPALTRDRARVLKKGAAAFQISEDEMRKVLLKSSNPAAVSSDEIISILGKIMVGLGYVKVGEALLVPKDSGMASFAKLGVQAEAESIVAKYRAGTLTEARAGLELTVLLAAAMLRGMGVPEAEVTSRANKVLTGRMSAEALTQYMEARQQTILVDEVGLKMFNGLTLSHEVLSKLYNAPTPRVNLVFKDVPADSLLGDTLFRADYALKTICTDPDVKERIPGFLTEMDYLYAETRKQGVRSSGDAGAEVGHRLIPGEVRMRVSPAGTLVAFDKAQVKIIGWLIKPIGKRETPKVASIIKRGVESYGDYLTGQYDALARIYPELHRLREAEKLIALARWATSNHYQLVVENAHGVRVPQSPTAVGFCQAVFTADAQEFSLTLMVEGGAAFDKDEGEAWVKPTVNNEITADVSKQLVMSAVLAQQAADEALGGNMEAARDLADKSARAMTGDIDMTKLPALGDLPIPGNPAQVVELSSEALAAVDRQLRQIDQAKVTMQKAADLAQTSPEEAAQMRAAAVQQQQLAQARLQSLRDALDKARKDYGSAKDVVLTIRNLDKVTIPAIAVAGNPSVVTLQNLRHAAAFAGAVENAATKDVPALLDEALKIANGAGTSPANGNLLNIGDKSVLAFQQANIAYAKAQDNRRQCAENLKTAQQRRELAYQAAKTRRAEVERELGGKTDDASLKKKQQLLADIEATVKAADDEWAQAKAQLVAAEAQADKAREESVRILRALALGQDPARFHPPIAGLPALTDNIWQDMRQTILEEADKHQEERRKLQKSLAFPVPPLKTPERIHEGVILGFGTDATDAANMEKDGFSPLMQQSYADRKILAEQARKEGKEIGGALVVSFGTPELKSKYVQYVNEGVRVLMDHLSGGEFSLITPQAQAAVEKLAGKEFNRLIAHSNGASVAEALIRSDVIKVNELNIVGGDMSLTNDDAYQQLINSGKVKRVVVWVNLNDPVPGLTSLLGRLKPEDRTEYSAKLLAQKLIGDTHVEYRFMRGIDYRDPAAVANSSGFIMKMFEPLVSAHYLEASYFGGMAVEQGYQPVIPERVMKNK
ncbi:MAG: PDZ domain-containing protein [Armatimonadota bacterium]